MSPRKLTEDDKQEILHLYRTSKATTSTLASQYEVSSSTISRFLKNKLSDSEYEDLIQQKRLARTPRGEATVSASHKLLSNEMTEPAVTVEGTKSTQPTSTQSDSLPESTSKTIVAVDKAATDTDASTSASTRRRRRSSATTTNTTETQINTAPEESPELVTTPEKKIIPPKTSDRPILKQDRLEEDEEDIERVEVLTLKAMLGEDIDEDDEDEDDEDDEWEDAEEEITYPHADKNFDLKIMPLSAALLPRTCYLVIDRSAELIVKPLKDFADLGLIPETEVKQKTLPIFDNHRIAKRFSHRRERVIKVPDSQILYKTSHYLEAKGITRLLIDGKIYSLPAEV